MVRKMKKQSVIVKITCIFLLHFFLYSGTNNYAQNKKDNIVVVIDPGHGGKDPGNLSGSKKYADEKILNLKIALKLGNYIDSLLQDVTVVYTRTKDIYVSPKDRAEKANAINADYFISIHCNSATKTAYYGTEIHIHNLKCKDSYHFARKIEAQLSKRAKRKCRGIKTFEDRESSHILVVKDTDMPAVLVECGFMSNMAEAKYLNTDYGQSIIASAIFRAFRSYSGAKPLKSKAKKQKACKPVYKIQIMSSAKPVSLQHEQFKLLKMKVKQVIDPRHVKYKYMYFVGNTCDYNEAKKMMNKARKNGFPDAYIIKTGD